MRNNVRNALPSGQYDEQKQKSSGEDYKIVSIRLRSAEFDTFFKQAEAIGITSNLALRIAARRIGGFLEIDRQVREQLEATLLAIGEISRNIGLLHAAYSDSGEVDTDNLALQRAAFGQEFAKLDALLRSILNVARRRSDGRQLLEGALAIDSLIDSDL